MDRAKLMRTILITGCSSGIGLQAARALQRRGWRVLATLHYEETMKPRLTSADPAGDSSERGVQAVPRKLVYALESPRPRARYFVTGKAHPAWW